MHISGQGTAIVGTCLVAMAALAHSRLAAQDPQREVHDYLAKMKLSSADLTQLEAGRVVAHVEDGPADRELITVAAVKIRVPRDQVANYYGQMIAYVDGQVTLGFGRFNAPPTLADVKDMGFDKKEVDELRSCAPGKCDIRLGGAGLETLRSALDWSAADYVERANGFARKAAIDYVAAYQARGDQALVTYNDRAQPVSMAEEWRGILGNSPFFQQYNPELMTYLQSFPAGRPAGARDIIYWVKEDYGLKPVISIVHGVVYQPPRQTDRTIVAQKQLYASHYYDGSLAVATLLDTQDAGQPATYLVYVNRSRGDVLKGGFGGVKRNLIRSQARKAAEETLGTIKRMLET